MLQINEKDNKLFDMIVKFKMLPYDMAKKYMVANGQHTNVLKDLPAEDTYKKSTTTFLPLAKQV